MLFDILERYLKLNKTLGVALLILLNLIDFCSK